MLQNNRDMIEQGVWQHLKEHGTVDDVVLVVVDADDAEGGRIARTFAPEFAVQFEAMRNAGEIPTLTLALAREAAAHALAGAHPQLAQDLAEPPASATFWLCGVARGGATLVQWPIPVLPVAS